VAKSNDKRHIPVQLEHPPTLPARADPKSEDARLLGPLSLRCQVNIRWRFFSQQRDLTWWPLEVDSSSLAGIQPNPSYSNPCTGFEGLGMVQEIERLATQLGDQPRSISLGRTLFANRMPPGTQCMHLPYHLPNSLPVLAAGCADATASY